MKGSLQAGGRYARLVAATDGAKLSAVALVGAAQLARRLNAELYVFHAVGDTASQEAVARQVAELLADVPHKLELRNLIAGTPMSPSRLIAEFADALGESLVVVGTHGRGGLTAALLGSTAAEVVSRPGHATMVYGPHAEAPTEIERVAVCVDGSEFSELCLDEAAMFSLALGVPLRIVQVIPPDLPAYVTVFEGAYVLNLSKELEALGSIAVESDVLHSTSPARAILDSVGKNPATMLVMATHGRLGFKRLRLGSVALEVVRGSRGPIALIRPTEAS